MWDAEGGPRLEEVSAAALLFSPFLLLLAIVELARPWTPAELAVADPVVQTGGGGAPWLVVGLGALLVGGWCWRYRPDRAALRRSGGWALAGLAAATLVTLALRLAVGPQLPGFIPPEESARPGLALGLSAGLGEEVVFRLALLPLLFAGLRKKLAPRPAAVVAALLTGVLFALSHELPPAGGSFDPGYVATRFLFPGVVMSLAFLWVSPALLLVAHAAAHLLIPALFG